MSYENQEGNRFPEIQLLPDFVHESNEPWRRVFGKVSDPPFVNLLENVEFDWNLSGSVPVVFVQFELLHFFHSLNLVAELSKELINLIKAFPNSLIPIKLTSNAYLLGTWKPR